MTSTFTYNLCLFITRQHAMHAERDIVLAIPHVCPSVRLAGIAFKRMDIVALLDGLVAASL